MFFNFLVGFLISFTVTLSIGPSNLGVIYLTIRHNSRAASRFSLAVSIVELLYATAAILSGKLIVNKIDEFQIIKIIVILFFFLAGIYFFFKKENTSIENNYMPVKKSFFLKGLIVAGFNPLIITYWLVVTTWLFAHKIIILSHWHMVLIVAGGFTGKYTCLSLYGLLSAYIKKRASRLAFYLNKFIGLALIVLSVLQAIHLYKIA